MLRAVSGVHSADIVHSDIKPDNFLFSSDDPDAPLKLIDFGQAQRIRPRQLLHAHAGTAYYMSPQQVRASPRAVMILIKA